MANFPDPDAIAAAKGSLLAVLFPFAGVPPHMRAYMCRHTAIHTLHVAQTHKHTHNPAVHFMAQELPHCSVHNLHHNAPATAEMAVALLLAAAKRVLPSDRSGHSHPLLLFVCGERRRNAHMRVK